MPINIRIYCCAGTKIGNGGFRCADLTNFNILSLEFTCELLTGEKESLLKRNQFNSEGGG